MKLLFSIFFLSSLALGAGSVSVSREYRNYGKASGKFVEVITVAWTADSAAATVPDTAIQMCGFVIKVITNPGGTAPTANYDIALGDPEDTNLDALGGALANRHTSNTEQVAPVLTAATAPVFLCGSYTQQISNNSVNSATGRILYYLAD